MKNNTAIILLLLCGLNFAQPTKTEKDTLGGVKKVDVSRASSNLSFIGFAGYRFQNLYFPFSGQSINPSYYYGKIPLGVSDQFVEIKRNLTLGFKVMERARERKNLGVVGKILGYTNAAAAFGLAAYHISKYGWNGEKLKKRK